MARQGNLRGFTGHYFGRLRLGDAMTADRENILETMIFLNNRCIHSLVDAYHTEQVYPPWVTAAIKRHEQTIRDLRIEIERGRNGLA